MVAPLRSTEPPSTHTSYFHWIPFLLSFFATLFFFFFFFFFFIPIRFPLRATYIRVSQKEFPFHINSILFRSVNGGLAPTISSQTLLFLWLWLPGTLSCFAVPFPLRTRLCCRGFLFFSFFRLIHVRNVLSFIASKVCFNFQGSLNVLLFWLIFCMVFVLSITYWDHAS